MNTNSFLIRERRSLMLGLLLSGLTLTGACQSVHTGSTAAATSTDRTERAAAERMIRASESTLAPVYAPLAAQLVCDFNLQDRTGIGLDIGGGPGHLVLQLAQRTRLYWINLDINPYCFEFFNRQAAQRGLSHRVCGVWADAQNLPFRDGYADVIVSRGSYQFWPDCSKGFAEIHRVLKPGGVAYIGRGFSRDLPLTVAKQIRARQGGSIKYDRPKHAELLREIMEQLKIEDFKIHLPQAPGGADINYGVWVEFHKPTQ